LDVIVVIRMMRMHWGSGCQHLVGLVKSDGVYNILALVCEKDGCENLPLLCRGPAAEGSNNASALPYSSSDGK